MTSIQEAYNIDSDDEEEPVSANVPKNASSHIQEITKVPLIGL
jgi:hypothetical protein